MPPWLARQYPEIAVEQSTGRRAAWGARQEADFTHAAFRFHAERVTRAILARHAAYPAVIGFQVDTEPGLRLPHNHGVFQRFTDHLRHTYGDVETLNREWGLVYWSHRLTTWADLWTPDGNQQPQYDVAWRAFLARQTTEFVAWQAGIVREYARPGQFVTTCLAYEHPAMADDELAERLDGTAGNPYYDMQDALTLPDPAPDGLAQSWKTTGVWALYRSADRIFSSRQEPFLVTETNTQAISGTSENRPAFDGQWRQAAWALVSRGARMIEYWHWHTLHFGTETYWGGILPHSGRPGRVYAELGRLGAEFETAGALAAGLDPDADLAMVYSMPTKWLMQKYPPLAAPDGEADGASYQRIFDPFYRGAFEAGCQVSILHARQLHDPRSHRDGVPPRGSGAAPSRAGRPWPLPRRGLAARLVRGLRPRRWPPGPGPPHRQRRPGGRARHEATPARLTTAAGAYYDEFSNLAAPLPLRTSPGSPLTLPQGATATDWVEGLTPAGATVLAEYDHPHFGRWAATTHPHGAGRVTCVGTVPGRGFARALAAWLAPAPVSGWRDLTVSVTATTGTSPDGRRVHVVHNWNWEPADIPAPTGLTDALTHRSIAGGSQLQLGPWDVRVFVQQRVSRTESPSAV